MKKLAELLAYLNALVIGARLALALLRALKLNERIVARVERALDWLDVRLVGVR